MSLAREVLGAYMANRECQRRGHVWLAQSASTVCQQVTCWRCGVRR